MADTQAATGFIFNGERMLSIAQAAILFLSGFVVARIAGRYIGRYAEERYGLHEATIMRRWARYLIVILFTLSALHQLGFDLSVLLGAAGILSVAIGFASQTSASNLISGLFLVGERPFSVGDTISIEHFTGEVLSIDLLSVKLRTFDNLYVRIPNETLIKSPVTTLTRFPNRRIDIKVGVAYGEDVNKVQRALTNVAASNPQCLADPRPSFLLDGFGDSAVNISFLVWTKWTGREEFNDLKTTLHKEILEAFHREGITIPFPHRTLLAEGGKPFTVRIVEGE